METGVKNNFISGFDFIAILSAIGIIGWIVSGFFGGMILFLISSTLIIIPILLLYLVSAVDLLINIRNKGKSTSRIKLVSHGIIILSIIIFNLYNSELFKSEIILSAILKDDLFHYRLVLRENGVVENQINGFLGFEETHYGKYSIENEEIIFSIKPYVNDFIPDTLLLDRKQNAIFINKDSNGKFRIEKSWLNHFEIE